MEVLLLDTLYKVVEEAKEGFVKEEVESKFTLKRRSSDE